MSATPPRPRRPYSPPKIRTEVVYERRSLACGKTTNLGRVNPRCRRGIGGGGPHRS